MMISPSDPTWVDAKVAQHKIDELINVIVEMADVGGEDIFPTEPGAEWFDAVKRHDPALATKLADPDRAGFPYRVTLFDIPANRSTMFEAPMTDLGVDLMIGIFNAEKQWKADFLSTLHKEAYAEKRGLWIGARPQIFKVYIVDPSAEEK